MVFRWTVLFGQIVGKLASFPERRAKDALGDVVSCLVLASFRHF